MENKTVSGKEARKRKLFLMIPLLTLPFVTVLFWILGGGNTEKSLEKAEEKKGFNFHLPEPKIMDDSSLNKMSYYDRAALDSMKFQDQIEKDPNYLNYKDNPDSIGESDYQNSGNHLSVKDQKILNSNLYQDHTTAKIYEKLQALQKVINVPVENMDKDQDMREFDYTNSSTGSTDEMKGLEEMMNTMNAPSPPDPELKELGGMLENILDIQHPERVTRKLKKETADQKAKAFSVAKKVKEDNVTLLRSGGKKSEYRLQRNTFYSLEQDSLGGELQNALEAVIHETQTIVSGSVVKLRLTSDVSINRVLIKKNSFLYGVASLKGERLEIKIDNIKFRNSIYPVNLGVYDLDGIIGIYIPGAINRDVAKASVDRSIQSIGLSSLDDSWGTQAAGMGVEAAKSLLSKKVKLIKVIVKAGYKVLLYDEKQKELN